MYILKPMMQAAEVKVRSRAGTLCHMSNITEAVVLQSVPAGPGRSRQPAASRDAWAAAAAAAAAAVQPGTPAAGLLGTLHRTGGRRTEEDLRATFVKLIEPGKVMMACITTNRRQGGRVDRQAA
jgi:spore germination cell wall hydrolase CwlJ-like protein